MTYFPPCDLGERPRTLRLSGAPRGWQRTAGIFLPNGREDGMKMRYPKAKIYAEIPEEDYARVSQHKWFLLTVSATSGESCGQHPARFVDLADGRRVVQLLESFLSNAPGYLVPGDGLDKFVGEPLPPEAKTH